ncbi:MAG: enoyl-CoA hydratase [Alphaproteobacteria bacterium]
MAAPEIRTVIEARSEGPIARVTLDNAARANCLSRGLVDGIAATFRELAAKPALRLVVVTGAGERSFMAGADLTELGAADEAAARDWIAGLHAAHRAIRDCPVPVIARINGACLGAGLELAASCDLRIAADHATFAMPEVMIDIPSVIEAALLPRLIGWGRASWLIYRGDGIDAATAERWGLVERVVPAADLDDAVEELVSRLLRNGPAGMRVQKRLMRDWERLPLDDAIRAGIDALAAAYRIGDPPGHIAAYMAERRKPADS